MAKHTTVDDRLEQSVPDENRAGYAPDVLPDKPLVPPEAYRVATPVGAPLLDDGLSVRHQFRFDPGFVVPAAVLGILPATTYVEVDAGHLHVRFGPWSLDTPIDNIVEAETTGPYALAKVLGPPRLGWSDRGVTFATNREVGLCLRFRDPVPALAPFGWLAHPAATVTVADPLALGRDLDRVRASGAG